MTQRTGPNIPSQQQKPGPSPPARSRDAALFAWQGWRLEVPPRWNPVKLEGTREQGFALFADMYQHRLGLSWQTPPKSKRRKFDPDAWAKRAMRDEVGTLAASEAKPLPLPVPAVAAEGGEGPAPAWRAALLYLDPEPPGRDVWVAQSTVSARLMKVTHHARRRERTLETAILPRLSDTPVDREQPWSVFELSCRVPPGLRLESQRLMAGDLSLTFVGTKDNKQVVTVRQVAVAQLALQRMPLDKWVGEMQRPMNKHYRPAGPLSDVTIRAEDGRELIGRKRRTRRRRRFFFQRWRPQEFVTIALHDAARDRLVLLQSTDPSLAERIGATVGWATA